MAVQDLHRYFMLHEEHADAVAERLPESRCKTLYIGIQVLAVDCGFYGFYAITHFDGVTISCGDVQYLPSPCGRKKKAQQKKADAS